MLNNIQGSNIATGQDLTNIFGQRKMNKVQEAISSSANDLNNNRY